MRLSHVEMDENENFHVFFTDRNDLETKNLDLLVHKLLSYNDFSYFKLA
jgi:hypothetical protein